MKILAEIKGIEYNPILCRELKSYSFSCIDSALASNGTFILNIDKDNKIALSWWVSAKRTRSYPYARVYDSLGFTGKRATVIPVLKDEGADGDRDFLQWDTISLMSLLGVYVIIGYYKDAEPSSRYKNKITKQRFDMELIKKNIEQLLSYQSDALHWNLAQVEKAGEIGQKALISYGNIANKLGIKMHSITTAQNKIAQIIIGKENFMAISRQLAEKAQMREQLVTQPKEKVSGSKATITINNYLGGYYYFTSDEVKLEENKVYLIECKHSKNNVLPSLEDIKDGLVKMILFTNLQAVNIDGNPYKPQAVLKLTTDNTINSPPILSNIRHWNILQDEAKLNGFELWYFDKKIS